MNCLCSVTFLPTPLEHQPMPLEEVILSEEEVVKVNVKQSNTRLNVVCKCI